MTKQGYWYLATPYKLYPDGQRCAFNAALAETARLLGYGVPVYSPIVHNHQLSSFLPQYDGDFDFWVEQVDRPLMEGAGGLLVCMLPSWEISAGIKREIEIFKLHRKPVVFYTPIMGACPVLPPLDRQLGVVLIEEVYWQDETFPLSTSSSRAAHLKREAEELSANPEDSEEMADVLLLLSHLAHGKGGLNVSLVQSVIGKQVKNKARLWGEPDSEGVVEHVKSDETAER